MKDRSKEKLLLKNTALYAVSNFGSKILTFLIVPLYTYYLTTSEYGTADTIISIVNVLAPISVLSIHEGLLRWLLTSVEEDSIIIWTGLKIYCIFALLFDIIIGIVTLSVSWQYSMDFIFLLTALSFQTVMQYIARGLKKNKCFAVSGVIYTIIMLVLNILLIVIFKQGIVGMLRSMSIAHLISGLYLLFRIKGVFFSRSTIFDKVLAKQMLAYSCLLVPNAISWWVMNASDRIMLTFMIGSSFTGIYSIACKFPSIMNVIHTLFYQAWQEQAILVYESKTRDAYYTRIFNIYMRLSSCLIILLIPFTKLFINLFMNENYRISYQYVSILYLSSLFSSFSSFYGTGYISAKDPKNATLTTMIGAILNCVINLFFIKIIGVWAACMSTLVGYGVVYLIRVFQTRKYFKIILDKKSFFILLATAIVYSIMVINADTITIILMTCVALILLFHFNINILKWIVGAFKNRLHR